MRKEKFCYWLEEQKPLERFLHNSMLCSEYGGDYTEESNNKSREVKIKFVLSSSARGLSVPSTRWHVKRWFPEEFSPHRQLPDLVTEMTDIS